MAPDHPQELAPPDTAYSDFARRMDPDAPALCETLVRRRSDGAEALPQLMALPDGADEADYEILHPGRSIAAGAQDQGDADDDLLPSDDMRPVMAIIDDGIAFLHARFRRSRMQTRFRAVWLMASRGKVPAGRVLSRAQIDGWLAADQRLEEGAIYRRLNADLYDVAAHRATEHGFSHGTHVLDVAAGADFTTGDAARDWPLLAVQLPPEAVDDTAGTQLEPLIVAALAWILKRAERMGGRGPVIVTLAMATFAGPKDGSKPVEALMSQLLDAFAARTGREARLLLAWGNARLTRQAARLTVAPDTATGLTWRLPPDDETASYLELRSTDIPRLSDLRLRLTPPGSAIAQTLPPLPPDHHLPVRDAGGRVVGRLYHVGLRPSAPGVQTPAHLVLAMAPTEETRAQRPVAPHGGWQVEAMIGPGREIDLRLEVQRDDSLLGSAPKGRQSWLDDAAAHGADPESAGWGLPGQGSAVTRRGSQSAFASAPSDRVIAVAAATEADLAPAVTSAEGDPALRPGGPALSALADRAPGTRGLLAAGTLSGSVRAGDGTSVAAARAARALALHYDGQTVPPPGPAEVAALVAARGVAAADSLAVLPGSRAAMALLQPGGAPDPAALHARLGEGVLT